MTNQLHMLTNLERDEISRLWTRKLEQDAQNLPQAQRHRNLEPASAEFICALAEGIGARRLLEIGGSTGISTIALATAACATGGSLISVEIEPDRQAESRETIERLGLSDVVRFLCCDAAEVVPDEPDIDFALIDCEKEDYIRFLQMLRMRAGGVIVADNIISHHMAAYSEYVRQQHNFESITLPIGKGLEVTRVLRV